MPRIAMNAVSRSTLILAVTVVVAACDYSGERVFTRQNQAASALATMSMEAESKNAANLDKIYEAEAHLHKACAPLRAVAEHRMADQMVGLDTELVALISMDQCATETQRVEQLIRLDDPAAARFFLDTKTAR